MQKVAVESQSINWVAYEEKERTLTVEFVSGVAYRYFDVPASTFEWLLKAESKGRFMNRLVKDQFRYEEVSEESESTSSEGLMGLLQSSLDEGEDQR